jgi:hypothetical protein
MHTCLAVVFAAPFDSSLEPNLFAAWGIEVPVLEIAGHNIDVVQGCNEESKSDTVM